MDSSIGSQQAFSVQEVFEKGYEVMKKYWASYLLVFLCIVIVSILIRAGNLYLSISLADHRSQLVSWLFMALNLIWNAVSVLWLTRLTLRGVDGQTMVYPEIFGLTLPDVAYMTGLLILLSLVVCVGLILFIVPGVIAALMFGFAPYIMAEKKLDPISAMKASMALSEGHRTSMFVYAVATVGMAIALFVGYLVLGIVAGLLMKYAVVLAVLAGIVLVVVAICAYFGFVMTVQFGWAYIYRKLTAMRPEALKA